MALIGMDEVVANKLKYKQVYHTKGYGRLEYAGTMGRGNGDFRETPFKFYDITRTELFWSAQMVMQQLPWLFRRDEFEAKPLAPEVQVGNTLIRHFQYEQQGGGESLIYQGKLDRSNPDAVFLFTGVQSNEKYYWTAATALKFLTIFHQQEVEMAKGTEDPQYRTLGQKVQEALNPKEPWNLVFAYGSKECEALELLGFKCLGGGRDDHDRQVMVFQVKPFKQEK